MEKLQAVWDVHRGQADAPDSLSAHHYAQVGIFLKSLFTTETEAFFHFI
jgi:hypothetical protein